MIIVKLVLISLCIAIPLSYWDVSNWLQAYTYRGAISWWIFGFAALSILLITLVTVSFQSITVGSWQLAVGGWRLAVGSWQLEGGRF